MRLFPARFRSQWAILTFSSFAASAVAQTRDNIAEILDRNVSDFSVQGQEARIVLEGIGAGYRFPVVVDPEVQGTVTFEIHNAKVRTVIEAICEAKGWNYEVSDRGYLLIRRFVTRIYPVDYLQMTQTGSSSASINLSESAGSGISGSVSGLNGGSALSGIGNSAVTTPGQNGASGSVSGGSSTLSVSQQNDADFWGRLESDLKGMVGEGESLVVNRFAGLVQLRGSLKTHSIMEAYLRRVLSNIPVLGNAFTTCHWSLRGIWAAAVSAHFVNGAAISCACISVDGFNADLRLNLGPKLGIHSGPSSCALELVAYC
jgi:hypothetical protein